MTENFPFALSLSKGERKILPRHGAAHPLRQGPGRASI